MCILSHCLFLTLKRVLSRDNMVTSHVEELQLCYKPDDRVWMTQLDFRSASNGLSVRAFLSVSSVWSNRQSPLVVLIV